MRRTALAACAAALIALPVAPASTAPLGLDEPRGMTCTITGAAKFSPGLNTEARTIQFTFKGELTDCESSGGITSGVVKAAGKVEDASCASGQGIGKAKVHWNDGSQSSFDFETTDVTAGVVLRGETTKSTAEVPAEGDPVYGLLAFDADPTQCQGNPGIKGAEFEGQVGGGSPS